MPTVNQKLQGVTPVVTLTGPGAGGTHREPSPGLLGAPPAAPARRPQRARRAPRQSRTGDPRGMEGLRAPLAHTQAPTRTLTASLFEKGASTHKLESSLQLGTATVTPQGQRTIYEYFFQVKSPSSVLSYPHCSQVP